MTSSCAREDNIFAESEIPAGWGLLVRVVRGEEGAADELRLARAPARLEPTAGQRVALLETIAFAGTKAVNRLVGRDVPGGRAPASRAAAGNAESGSDGGEGDARHWKVIVR